MPIRQETVHCILEAFSKRQLIFNQISIARVITWIALILLLKRGRWDIVGTTPDEHLFLAMLLCCLSLIKALKSPIMTFVQTPVSTHGQPYLIHLIEGNPQSPDRPLKNRSVGFIKNKPVLLENLAGR